MGLGEPNQCYCSPENPTFSYCRSRALVVLLLLFNGNNRVRLTLRCSMHATHTPRTRSWEMRTSAKAENVSKGRLLPVCVLESERTLLYYRYERDVGLLGYALKAGLAHISINVNARAWELTRSGSQVTHKQSARGTKPRRYTRSAPAVGLPGSALSSLVERNTTPTPRCPAGGGPGPQAAHAPAASGPRAEVQLCKFALALRAQARTIIQQRVLSVFCFTPHPQWHLRERTPRRLLTQSDAVLKLAKSWPRNEVRDSRLGGGAAGLRPGGGLRPALLRQCPSCPSMSQLGLNFR